MRQRSPKLSPEEAAKADAEEAERVLARFAVRCERERPLWDARITSLKGAHTEEALAKRFAANAKEELQDKNNEITVVQLRSATVMTVAAIMLAIAFRFNAGTVVLADVSNMFIWIGSLVTSTAFVIALWPMAPPYHRAMKQAYDKRRYWTLLVVDDFTSWVMDCWLCDRRTDVITKYKKAHAVAVRLLIGAAVLSVLGLAIGSFVR